MKDFLRNIAILVGFLLLLLVMFPDIVKQVTQVYGALGILPFVLFAVLISALPRKSRKKRSYNRTK